MRRSVLSFALGSLLCASVAERVEAQTPRKPKLVVLLVVDQMRQEYLSRYAPFFGRDGFARLIREGAELKQNHYGHATTSTGPGHALVASGTFGRTSGIIGNRFYNRQTRRLEAIFFDADAPLIDETGKTLELNPREDETSPRPMMAATLGDQLKLSNNGQSKVWAVSLKGRSAIALAGKTGRALWLEERVGGLTWSTYYGPQLPSWVKAFNARRFPQSFSGATWNRFLPLSAYSISRRDDHPNESDFGGTGRAFPHKLPDLSTGDAFWSAWSTTPAATDYVFAGARQIIENEGLGTDDHPDVLGVSLSSPDLAGHAFGPESHEVQDTFARLDRQLATFLTYLDRRVGRGNVTLALTSDHGACPLPESARELGFEAGRIKRSQISDAIESALTSRYGAPPEGQKWVLAVEDPGVILNTALLTAKNLDAAQVQREVGEAALTVPGMAAYFTRRAFETGTLPPHPFAPAFARSFHPQRSGDVLLLTKPFYFMGSYGDRDYGSTHGSAYAYDTHVPLLLHGAGIKGATIATRSDVADIAPTLSHLLGVAAPPGNEGRVLHEVLR